jgi:DNA-directed RNA polymerase specialized sigma24 family protein
MAPDAEFTRFYRQHHARLHGYCARRWRHAADDIAAEAFALAWRQFAAAPAQDGFGWLCRLAVDSARRHRLGHDPAIALDDDLVDTLHQ